MIEKKLVGDSMLGRICNRCNRFFRRGEEIQATPTHSWQHVACVADEKFRNRESAYPKKDFQEWD